MLVDILGYNPLTPTQVGTLRLDIVRQCEYQYDQEVTGHPVETGFEIHDMINNRPLKVTMTGGISSHPVTWFYVNGIGKSKFADGLAALEAIRNAKMPITIVRPDKILTDMVLTSCRPVKSDESRSVIWVDLAFQQIEKVSVQTTEIPPDIVEASMKDSAGETAADGGQATQTDVASAPGGEDLTQKADDIKEKTEVRSSSIYDFTFGGKKVTDIL